MAETKLKVLCLHGYGQSGDYFRQKLGGIRKLVKKCADFEYVTSPHCANPEESENTDEPGSRAHSAWWFTNEEEQTYDSKEHSSKCFGFETSVEHVENILLERGPFDGILGFSQGACFLSLLCSLQQQGSLRGGFKFAVFVSGYLSRCVAHQRLYNEQIALPTLHVFGQTDVVIPEEMSQALADICEDKQIIRHPGGHYMPSNSFFKEPYLNFLRGQLTEKLDGPER